MIAAIGRVLRRSDLWSLASASAISQAFAFAAGLIVLRALPPKEYAFYVLVGAVVAAAGAVAESGIGTALLARVARLPTPSRIADNWMSSAVRLKTRLGASVLLPALVLVAFLLRVNGATWPVVAVLTLVTALTMVSAFSISVLSIGLQVTGNFRALRRADVVGSAFRLSLVWLTSIVLPFGAIIALVINLLASWLQRLMERSAVRRRFSLRAERDRRTEAVLSSSVIKLIPVSLGTIAGEQLVLIVLSVTGNVHGIAAVAALGRYSALLLVVNGLVFTLGAARLSALDVTRHLNAAATLIKTYSLVALLFVVISVAASPLLLRLLGPSYDDLFTPFVIITVGSALTNLALYGFGSVNHAMGWVRGGWVYLPVMVVVLAAGVVLLPVHTPIGAAALSASLCLPNLASQLVRLRIGLARRRKGSTAK